MHDRRSIKKTAVSVIYDNNEVAADLMWLMIFSKERCLINVDPGISGFRSTRSQCVTTFRTSYSSCTAGRVIGNRNGRRRPGVREPLGGARGPEVIGKPEVSQPRRVRDPRDVVAMSLADHWLGVKRSQ